MLLRVYDRDNKLVPLIEERDRQLADQERRLSTLEEELRGLRGD